MKNFGINLSNFAEADVALLGVLLGRAAKSSVGSIREQSWHVEFFDFDRQKNLFSNVKIADLGNLYVGRQEQITEKVSEIIRAGKIPFLLGGSHQLTLYALKAFGLEASKPLPKVLIFDAHTDIYDKYTDEKVADSVTGLDMSQEEKSHYNAATWVRRFAEVIDGSGASAAEKIAYFGVRSGAEEHFDFMKKKSIAYFTPKMLRENSAAKDFIADFTTDANVYLTLDIDFFDPAIAPAVYHPEPSGCSFAEFQELISEVKGKIAGADVVELKPIEGNFVTEFLAARAIFEILGKINDQSKLR